MKKNMKSIFFVATILVLIFSISAISATEVSNDTTPVDTVSTTDSVQSIDATTVADTEVVEKSTAKNIEKQTKNIKKSPNTINVNDTNFDDYFTSSGFTTDVNDGDTLNFTTDITRTSNSYIVNKAVNILGNNFTLDLNTIKGYEGASNPTYIEFNNGSSNSNISYLKLYNTQVFVTTASNITFDHINDTIYNQGVGMGTGYFAMRNGVINITVKNSYFNATNNTGCSAIVLTLGENCTINNNTIIGQGTVGNLIYLNLFGATSNANGITKNKGNTISNNTIIGPDTPLNICIAIVIGGPHNHIINNTINYSGTGITGNYAGTYDPTTNTTDDYYNLTYYGNGYINNTLNNGATFSGAQRSIIAGNTFTGTASIAKNSTVTNNTFLNTVTISSYTNFTENIVNGTLNIGSNNNVSYNFFETLNINGNNNIVTYNNYTDTINIYGDNNTIENNEEITLDSINLETNKQLKMDEPTIYYLSNDNYSTYFKSSGVFKARAVNSIFCFTEELSQLNVLSIPANYLGKNYTITSSPGVVMHIPVSVVGGDINLVNMTFDLSTGFGGDNTNYNAVFVNGKVNVSMENVNLTFEQEKVDAYDKAILVQSDANFTMKNCNINSHLIASSIDWLGNTEHPQLPVGSTIHITSRRHVSITDCNITTTESDSIEDYSSIYSIILDTGNHTIANNTLRVNGEHWMYNVILRSGTNNLILDNNIITNSTNYSAGVYLTGTNIYNNIIDNNTINTIAGFDKERDTLSGSPEFVSYGVVIENRAYQGSPVDYGYGNVLNNTISNNNFIGSAYNIYGVEIFGADANLVENNTVNFTGTTTLGLGAIGHNNTFQNNNITVSGTQAEGSTVDYLGAGTTGVLLIRSQDSSAINNNIESTFSGVSVRLSNNSNVEYNNITSTDEYTVLLRNSNNTKVTNNYLIAKELKGDESVLNNGVDNTIENNLPIELKNALKVDTTEFTIGQNATIKASIYLGDDVASDINKGKVVFKVNGKTLKDSNNKVIYAKVTNGVATIEGYEVPESWNKDGITIEAVYSGSTQCEALRSEKQEMTISYDTTPSITTSDITATVGSTVTLKAQVTGSSDMIAKSKVVFKINGKSVKDSNGKVIYAQIENGEVSFDYTLPATLKAKSYNIVAVLIMPNYERLEDSKTLTLTKA